MFRLAAELGLDGWVLNDERGVVLEAQGPSDAVDQLLRRLPAEAPPLAEVEAVELANARPQEGAGFRIADSVGGGEPEALVSPDTATCEDCLAELLDPADRRHRYPFINCTNCGPRFTIVQGVPYDRQLTTMAGFRDVRRRAAPSTRTPATGAFTRSPTPAPPAGRTRASSAQEEGDAVAQAAQLLCCRLDPRGEGPGRVSPGMPSR